MKLKTGLVIRMKWQFLEVKDLHITSTIAHVAVYKYPYYCMICSRKTYLAFLIIVTFPTSISETAAVFLPVVFPLILRSIQMSPDSIDSCTSCICSFILKVEFSISVTVCVASTRLLSIYVSLVSFFSR